MGGIGNTFINEATPDVDQTIRWARESLQRRRGGLNTKRQDRIASSKVDRDTLNNGSDMKLNETLERGRSILAEAEARSKILEHYAANKRIQSPPGRRELYPIQSKIQDASFSSVSSEIVRYREPKQGRGLVAKFFNCTDLINNEKQLEKSGVEKDPLSSLINIPSEKPDWDVIHCCKLFQSTPRTSHSVSKLSNKDNSCIALENLIFEGEARARLDKLVSSTRIRGEQSLKIMPSDDSSPKKQLSSSFDPTLMRAAKRAALKNAKRAEESIAAEEAFRRMSIFKARPLPRGVRVTSNLHAPTLSFQSKQVGTVDRLLRKDSKLIQPKCCTYSLTASKEGFDDSSLVTSRSSNWSTFNICGRNESEKDRARQVHFEKSRRKVKILDFVNHFITPEKGDDSSVFSVDEEDLIDDELSLHQQICVLEAKLRREKFYGRSILNDIVDIDQNVIIENIICGGSKENMKTIVDWLKEKLCDPIEAWKTDDIILKSPDASPCIHEETEQSRKRTIYRRDEDWLKKRERKRLDALTLREETEMTNVTGKPEISFSKESWAIAKKSHEETLKKVAEEEAESRKRKDANERITSEVKMIEIMRLQEQIKANSHPKQSVVRKEEQKRRVDKLSQPKQTIPGDRAQKNEQQTEGDSTQPIRGEGKIRFQPKSIDLYRLPAKFANQPINDYLSSQNAKQSEFVGKNFSDMNDKEFQKMLNQINRKSKPSSACESSSKSGFKRDANEAPALPMGQLKDNEDAHNYWKNGQYCSSSAQERLMIKFNNATFNEIPSPNPKIDRLSKTTSVEYLTSNSFKKNEACVRNERGGSFLDLVSQVNGSLRLRVRDARGFSPDTVYRIPYQAKAGEKGVSLLVGKMIGGDDDLVITVIFDNLHFDESSAASWWDAHKGRITMQDNQKYFKS
ncbi:hypothetical protein ACHAXS_012699 [Conticribra weissflogii]